MTYPNIIEDIGTLDERISVLETFKNNILDIIYPIGSIYTSVNEVSPQTFLGGTWEQIQDTFLLCSGSTYSAGSTGGEATHTLTVAETPAHTHTRGTMNITGSTQPFYQYNTGTGGSGCFVPKSRTGGGVSTGSATYTGCDTATFDASRNWTGETSSVGSSQSHNNMPPYLAVYVWKRIA